MKTLAFALAFAVASPVAAQTGAVALLVIDDATDQPIGDAKISGALAGQTADGITDAHGRYLYRAPQPGKVVFLIRRLGYNVGALTVEVVNGDTARVTFAMTPSVQTLAAVDVRDSMTSVSPFLAEFENRVKNHVGSATYITRQEIEKRHSVLTTDLFRRIPSVTVWDSSGVLLAVTKRMPKLSVRQRDVPLSNCVMQVAVDGMAKEWGFAVNSLPPEQIHGIEIYPGPATIPAQYQGLRRDAYCGLIMIWTRRDK
jgi:hypothetical protein